MGVFFLPKEAVLLEFKRVNSSGWRTNYRLILCDHEPGYLGGHIPKINALKDFEKTQIKGSALTVYFKGRKKDKIVLAQDSHSLLQEIKAYIEEAAKYHQ
jgi:hypothetical protein